MQSADHLIVIPSRFDSVRFPGKPLVKILGKSLIIRVCEQLSSINGLKIVATDHPEIYREVKDAGFEVRMTSSSHENGTTRSLECLDMVNREGIFPEILVNVQGDEPLIEPNQISALIDQFDEFPDMHIATLCKAIDQEQDLMNPNIVKVVKYRNSNGYEEAMYFSRAPIPFPRSQGPEWRKQAFKHVGIYAFRTSVLPFIKDLPVSELENIEKLEQLRWLANGLSIGVFETSYENQGVDVPEDISLVENILKKKNKL